MEKVLEKKLSEIVLSLYQGCDSLILLSEETNLTDDLGFDSIMVVQLVAILEEEFGIIFEDEDLDMDKLTNYKTLKKSIIMKLIL
ncbi:hypothetical protein BG30_09670 [Bacillus subtilis subsp. subtilis]|nr:hypothetical protein BG30_09670 [Bacillus subtilis subsp. subtilis]